MVAPEWSRQRRRLELPEMRKTASSGRLAAMGELEECTEAACERNVLGASLNWRSGSVPTVAADKVAGDRHSVARASWRRRALVDTLADEHALFQGPDGERGRLGRR